jgi:hypothetical protein
MSYKPSIISCIYTNTIILKSQEEKKCKGYVSIFNTQSSRGARGDKVRLAVEILLFLCLIKIIKHKKSAAGKPAALC